MECIILMLCKCFFGLVVLFFVIDQGLVVLSQRGYSNSKYPLWKPPCRSLAPRQAKASQPKSISKENISPQHRSAANARTGYAAELVRKMLSQIISVHYIKFISIISTLWTHIYAAHYKIHLAVLGHSFQKRTVSHPGRKPVPAAIKNLVLDMKNSNPSWGTKHIRDELLIKLRIFLHRKIIQRILTDFRSQYITEVIIKPVRRRKNRKIFPIKL